MRTRTFALFALAAAATLGVACNGSPPRDASSAPSVPIHNTAAIIENQHAATSVDDSPAALAVLAERDRDARDRALDARYQGADLLTFLDVRPGMYVVELTAGGGYLTELFARAVGPGGRVYANLPPTLVARSNIGKALGERLARPVNAGVVRLDRELASPLPEAARDLDLVYLSLPFRTVEALGVDVAAMNRAAFAALKPGGTYVILDFRPRASAPSRTNLHTLHAEESSHVRRAVEAVGFDFVTEGRFLHTDADPNEWNAIAAPDPTALEEQDRFLLEFVRP